MRRNPYLLAACCCLLLACADDENPHPQSEVNEPSVVRSSQLSQPYFHPLQSAQLSGGFAGLATKDAQGRRYAYGEGGYTLTENGEAVREFGYKLLEHRKLSEAERLAYAATKEPRPAPVSVQRISERLTSWHTEQPGSSKHVILSVAEPPGLKSRQTRDDERIATEAVLTQSDYKRVRELGAAEHRLAVENVLVPVADRITETGASVAYRCKNLFCVMVEATPRQLDEILLDPLVERVDPIPQMRGNDVSGEEAADGHQLRQMIDGGYLGNPNGGTAMLVGVLEHGLLRGGHRVFKDGSGTSNRIWTARRCDYIYTQAPYYSPTGCISWSTAGTDDHATSVTALLVGDLTDDQDSNHTTYTTQERRSGAAREAEVKFWWAPDDSDIVQALDDIAGDTDIHILNMSIADEFGDMTCTGANFLSRSINDIYKAGILTFFAGGNAFTSTSSDCTVEEPGAAIGAFVVGALNTFGASGNETTVRTANLRGSSDRGGTWLEGQNRAIIDLVGTGYFYSVADGGGDSSYSAFQGTSAASPYVAGAAVQFADWYTVNSSSAIDNPGVLHAHMLLMGDRTVAIVGGNDFKANNYFHNRWGAGRLKMRRRGTAGLDDPSAWGSWSTCIEDGDDYIITLNGGNAIQIDVDVLKAVVYWFDERHEQGTPVDDIDMFLERKVGSTWQIARTANSSSNNAERIYYDDFSGWTPWRLRIHGADVTSDNKEGCGVNEMKVRIAWFYEDSDRESWEDLDDVEVE